MDRKFILAIDSGTTSARALLFDHSGVPVGVEQEEFPQYFPYPGWVEHDAMEIWNTQLTVILRLLKRTKVKPKEIAAIGVTNQRETTVVWDRHTGKPVHRAIVWQCRRTAELCQNLGGTPLESHIEERTGLRLDAYFSATKLRWILDHVEDASSQASKGDLLFGTIDSWLIWNLTGGRIHATDVSNASRTMLFDIVNLEWSNFILEQLKIPRCMLPQVRPSSGDFGFTAPNLFEGIEIPIRGVAGDQQAALFGQTCFEPGMAKNTYGTGCFLVMNTGEEPKFSKQGLLTTIAWQIGDRTTYALEGSVFSAGSTIQWLRDGLGLIASAQETEAFARRVEHSDGVYFVPAFAGLGAPYWDMDARGLICGLTRGSTKDHIVRAALESIAFQTRDLFEAVCHDSGLNLEVLQVDGGASANAFLMQFQADLLQAQVNRPKILESTALGAAYLAGLACEFWTDQTELSQNRGETSAFLPKMPPHQADRLYKDWSRAVQRARSTDHSET